MAIPKFKIGDKVLVCLSRYKKYYSKNKYVYRLVSPIIVERYNGVGSVIDLGVGFTISANYFLVRFPSGEYGYFFHKHLSKDD